MEWLLYVIVIQLSLISTTLLAALILGLYVAIFTDKESSTPVVLIQEGKATPKNEIQTGRYA